MKLTTLLHTFEAAAASMCRHFISGNKYSEFTSAFDNEDKPNMNQKRLFFLHLLAESLFYGQWF